jgi:ABC-type nitrate/sulfonate/bicarbonate transport system substrate-binding protein
VPNPSGFIDGLEKGQFDAYIVGEGLPAWQAQQAGYTPLVDFAQWKVPMASSSINVDAAWLENNRDTARRFIKSMIDAIAVIKQDRGAAYRAMTEYYGITDPAMLAFFYGSWDFPRKPYPAVEGLKTAQVFYDGHPGVRTDALRAAAIERFVDATFVRELDESGYIDRLYTTK